MKLSQALRLSVSPRLALTGAGGKTTALFQMAGDLPPPVIVTATTHLQVDQILLANRHFIAVRPADLDFLYKEIPDGVTLITGPLDGNRTTGVSKELLKWLCAFCDSHNLPLLIEADGAHRKPLKAPAEHEPPIPDFVETVVVVAGVSGLGKPLTDEFVHRPEIFARLSGLTPGENVTAEALFRVLTHPKGGLKNIPAHARHMVLLNQADTLELQAQAKALAEKLMPVYQSVVIASLGQNKIHAVYEPVAGIILAAGESRRFGQPKQLLDYHGQPFVRIVAQIALAAGLSPVLVVTGANAEQVEAAVKDLPVKIVRNAEWRCGQSSSVQAGLANLSLPHPASGHPSLSSPGRKGKGRDGDEMGKVGSAIFLLADQPQVSPPVLRALSERHAVDLSPIVAPQVQGQRANPVLFDRITFPDLMALTGDMGGRAVFSKFPVAYLPWHDEALLADIDTPEDYRKLANGK